MKPYRPSTWKSEYEKHKFNRNDRRSWGRKGRKFFKVKGRRAERKRAKMLLWKESEMEYTLSYLFREDYLDFSLNLLTYLPPRPLDLSFYSVLENPYPIWMYSLLRGGL